MKQDIQTVAKQVVAATMAALALATPQWSSAQTAPEKTIRARQSAYYLMGQQMATINATVKGDLTFDKASMDASAEALEVLSRLVGSQFPAGSDQGAPNKAKPEIWKEMPRFKQLGLDAQVEVVKLRAAVRSGDLAAIKAAYGATSKSCKACHDPFKAQ